MNAMLLDSRVTTPARTQASLLDSPAHDAWLHLCGCVPDDDERTHAVERLLRDGVDPHTQLGRNALLDAEFPELAALPAEMPDDAIVDTSDRYAVSGSTHLRMLRLVTDELLGSDLCGFGAIGKQLARMGLRRREVLRELALALDSHFRSTSSLRSIDIADPADIANRLRWLPATLAASEFGIEELLYRVIGAGDHDGVALLVSLHSEHLAAFAENDRESDDDPACPAEPFSTAAHAYLYAREHQHALEMARRAIEAASDAGDADELRRCELLYGEVLLADGQHDAAHTTFEHLVDEARSLDLRVFADIADACLDQDAPHVAFAWLDRGLDAALEHGIAALVPSQRRALESILDLRSDALPWNVTDDRGAQIRSVLQRTAAQQPFASTPIWRRNHVTNHMVVEQQPGRNDPCSCAGGAKFKRCCLA